MRRKKGSPKEADWLRARGYDGLYHPDPDVECGCFLDDLRPCGEKDTPCRGGHALMGGVYRPGTARRVRRQSDEHTDN